MKSIKEHLASADRGILLNCLSYRFMEDPLNLLERKDYTVQDIQDRYSRYMDAFIERLLGVETVRSDQCVFYMYTSFEKGEVLDLIDSSEIAADIDAPSLDCTFTEWKETLGFSVADTKLTQDHLIDLLAQYLEDASFLGTDEDSWASSLSDLISRLEEGVRSMDEGKTRSAEEVFEEIRRAHGFPEPEKDIKQDELLSKITAAIAEFDLYCRRRERRRILGEEKTG